MSGRHRAIDFRREIAWRRLQNQRLVGKPCGGPAEVVALLLAVQAQDFGGAKWALAQRLARPREAAIQAAFDAGEILRTHVLRPTWHFVTPADVRWLLELTAPRIKAAIAEPFRRQGLDSATFRRSRRVIEQQLAGGQQLTRGELGAALEAARISTAGERLGYLMMMAELDGVIVSGARRGKQHTYALLEERVAKAAPREREQALAELALRYLKSHGPALAQDLAWWSGLTLADAKRGIQACGAALSSASVDGKNYWFTPLGRATPHTTPVVQLLPNYDELLVAYRKRDEIAAPELVKHFGPRENLLFSNLVSVDGKLVGSFRRELGKSQVAVKVSLLRQLSAAERRELRAAAERYAAFLGVGLALSLEPTS